MIAFDFLVSAQAIVVRDDRNSYTLGSTIILDCKVDGYPAPNVTWSKDQVPLTAGGRIQITGRYNKIRSPKN